MSFLELAKARYSCRKYSAKAVEPEKIETVLAAAAAAPTGCNNQPQRILLVDDPQVLAKIRECTPFQFGAPVTFVLCYDKNACWCNDKGEGIGPIDTTIVMTHIILQAAELGLGTCIVGYYDKDALIKALNIPSNLDPVLLLPMGYPADGTRPSQMHDKRVPASGFVFRNHF